MTVNLVQVASVLDEATIKINDLQRSQVALETKVEENAASLKRDLQKAWRPHGSPLLYDVGVAKPVYSSGGACTRHV